MTAVVMDFDMSFVINNGVVAVTVYQEVFRDTYGH